MAKISKSVSFKNAEFRVTKDENGHKRIMIVETLKDDDIYTEFDDILEMFGDEVGLSISIKVENGFNGE